MIATTRESDKRIAAERVLMRSEWLGQSDRALIEQVFGKGVRPGEVAAVTGVSKRVVQRRVAKLVSRLMDDEVVYVLRHHAGWSRGTREVALAVWVRGLAMRDAGKELRMSLHRVRQEVAAVRVLCEAEKQRAREERRAMREMAGVGRMEMEDAYAAGG